jgi:hypothetical protein
MAADEFRRPDGTWSCTRDHVTQPCGNCDGCRQVAAENRMLGDLENWQPTGLAGLPANPVISEPRPPHLTVRLEQAWIPVALDDDGTPLHHGERMTEIRPGTWAPPGYVEMMNYLGLDP